MDMINGQRRWWDPIAGVSLILLVFLTAYSLELTYWTFDLNRITVIALLCILSGLLIGQSAFRGGFSIALLILYGAGIFTWQFVFSLSRETEWLLRAQILMMRVQSALAQAMENVPLDDGILFLGFMAALFAVLALAAGYGFTRKGKAYTAVFLLGAVFFTIQFFIAPFNRKFLMILIYGLLLVLYFGRVQYLQQRASWDSHDIKVDRSTDRFITQRIFFVSICFAVLAWGIPFLSEKIIDVETRAPLKPRTNTTASYERIKNILYPLRPQQDSFGDGVFADVIALGEARSREDGLVFTVQPPYLSEKGRRFYWKARVFSTYSGGYWSNEDIQIAQTSYFDPEPYLALSNEILPYSFTYALNKEELVTPQIVLDIDRDAEVAYYAIDEDSHDVLDLVDYQVVRPGDIVNVLGGYYDFSIEESLKSTGEYPDWVLSKYLSVPEDITDKIPELAETLTSGADSVFEKAIAITNYLRNTYRYKDEVDIPQFNDPVEWFLFSGRAGYCNYFASAETLMLRSVGIPARFVVGYSQGELTEDGSSYAVSKRDSHSWVEVFFPGQGWVIFEPTPFQPGVEYKEMRNEVAQLDRREQFAFGGQQNEEAKQREEYFQINQQFFEDPAEDETSELAGPSRRWMLWLLSIPAVFLLIWAGIRLIFMREKSINLPNRIIANLRKKEKPVPAWLEKWSTYESLILIERDFANIKMLARFLGLMETNNRTPREYLDALKEILPTTEENITLFSESYHREVYGAELMAIDDYARGNYFTMMRALIEGRIDRVKDYIQFRVKLLRVR